MNIYNKNVFINILWMMTWINIKLNYVFGEKDAKCQFFQNYSIDCYQIAIESHQNGNLNGIW